MIVLVATTVGLVVWLVLWALGAKAFDAFLVTGFFMLIAAAIRAASPYVRQILKGPGHQPGDA